MTEKLTWDEIKQRYPDEWVALVDYDWPAEDEVKAGVVFAHSASRSSLLEMEKGLKRAAVLFTGERSLEPLLFVADVDRKI